MKACLEKPFEIMRRKDGSEYSNDIIQNWYKARAYVLDKLKGVEIGPSSREHLHVVVEGDSPLMLSVVRQVALSAHYANYDEENPDETKRNRTVITFVSQKDDILDLLKKEEYLGNLLDYCKYSFKGITYNKDSYIDVEFRFVNSWEGEESEFVKKMTVANVVAFLKGKKEEEIQCIDIRKAVLAGRMYDLGTLIDNLPAEDIHCAKRYVMALDVFQHDMLRKPIEEKEKGKERKEEEEKEKEKRKKKALENVFCADGFESRAKGIKQYCKEVNEKRKKNKEKLMKEEEAWAENNEALSVSEHARWVVEKLIMGFRPLSNDERLEDEQRFGQAKKQYRKDLKERSEYPAHIDLCSYADLRRISPEDMKYDSFLMLAIPKILRKVENNSLCSAKRLRKHARTN